MRTLAQTALLTLALSACDARAVIDYAGSDGGADTDAEADTDTDTDADTDTDTDADTDADADTDTDTGPSAHTGDTGGDTGPGGDTDTGPAEGEVFDCADAPAVAKSEAVLTGPVGYHGLAFDQYGYIIGGDNQSLIQSDYKGSWSVLVPGVGYLEQMDYLSGGDLVIYSGREGSLFRISEEGAQTLVAASFGTYGVIVGPDEMIYTAVGQGIFRVDPETGETVTLIDDDAFSRSETPHSMNFSPDFSRLYVGTVGQGNLYAVDLDEDLNPTGDPFVFANVGGGFSGWHDGVAVDICGNLYVPDYYSSSLYKVTPDGTTTTFQDWGYDYRQYGHGAVFGSGIGGWRDDAIYLPMPYNGNTVKELVVGVPGREWEGEVLNKPY